LTASEPLSTTDIRRLHSGLRLLALRSLNDLDRAEEIAQEALARTIEASRNGRPKSIGAFAYGVARNLIVDEYRFRERDRRIRAEPHPAWGQNPTNTLDQIVSKEVQQSVRSAISRLSRSDREILRLTFYKGLTSVEIAERLGEPGTRIRKRKSRALDRIRHIYLEMESRVDDV
jgi:RNA polymerase sigma-70 factor (ECF subfamily)